MAAVAEPYLTASVSVFFARQQSAVEGISACCFITLLPILNAEYAGLN